jgi:serine/threonine protein kinase/Flp pilus assembly protein TadD
MQDEGRLFGEVAVERGFVTREQLDLVLAEIAKRTDPKPVGQVLVEKGLLTAPQATAIEKLKGVLARGNKRPASGEIDPADDGLELTGKTLGGCMILERVGSGSMGTTWRAHHLRLDRDVVVKVLHPRLVVFPGNLERFAREARAAAGLEHPAIVQIYDFDSDQGYHFIVMQYVDGQNLRHVLSTRGPFGPRRALWVTARVLEGLAHAHGKGIVHRDIKPANLIITREPRIKVADFGLVRILSLSTSEKISVFGEIIGTPQYMAPEQATCDDVDQRTDLYSLGISLFELVAGRAPFTGASTVEVLEKQIMEPLPDLRAIVPDATPDLCAFVAQLAAKDPAARFQTAEAALHALQALRSPERGTTKMLVKSPVDAPPDPSRDVDSPPIVSEEAIEELKRRLRASQELVAFELDDEDAPRFDEADKKKTGTREAAVEAAFAGAEVASSVLRRARQRIQKGQQDGTVDRVVPELLLEMLENGHVDDLLALEKELDKALPTSAAVAFFIGQAYDRRGKRDEARARLALATVLAPDHLPARLHLARVLVDLGRVDEAVTTLQEANRWHSTSVQAATRLAEVLYVVKRDPAAAVAAYEKAIELAPSRWQLRQQLALCLEELGRWKEAEAVLQEVRAWRQDASGAAAAKELLDQVKTRRRKRDKLQAAETQDEASELGAGGPGPETSARLQAIRIASAGNKWDKALKIAKRGLDEKPRSVPLLLACARAESELGRLSDAVHTYGLALAADPDNAEAQEGLMKTQDRRKKERGGK